MRDERDLAAYQAALLEWLAAGGALENHSDDALLSRDVIERFEPRMIEIAVELVAKWGRRAD